MEERQRTPGHHCHMPYHSAASKEEKSCLLKQRGQSYQIIFQNRGKDQASKDRGKKNKCLMHTESRVDWKHCGKGYTLTCQPMSGHSTKITLDRDTCPTPYIKHCGATLWPGGGSLTSGSCRDHRKKENNGPITIQGVTN